MFFNVFPINQVYNSSGKSEPYIHEDLDINFIEKESISFAPQAKIAKSVSLTSVIPTLLNIGFQLTTSALEKNSKKYSAEYIKHKSYLNAATENMPVIELFRKVTLKKSYSKEPKNALYIQFKPEKVDGIAGFVYWVEKIELSYSAAKAKSRNNTFDYTIELKPTFLIGGKKVVQELSPIVITSVKFNNKNFEKDKHRSDIILAPAGSLLTEVSIKIIESNPARIRAENILSMWNENKESAKTLIESGLPQESENEGDEKK